MPVDKSLWYNLSFDWFEFSSPVVHVFRYRTNLVLEFLRIVVYIYFDSENVELIVKSLVANIHI